MPVVFAPMCVDFYHHGHVNILREAASYGTVTVLLMTDEAIQKYKRKPCFSYKERSGVVLSVKYVDSVIPCDGLDDYEPKVKQYKPDVFLHGNDWKNGVQSPYRTAVMNALQEYGGRLIEPQYTPGVSSTLCHKHINDSS